MSIADTPREGLPRRWLGSVAVAATGALVVGFLTWPLLFTSTGLDLEWSTRMWFMWQESRVLAQRHLPGLFIHSGTVFYPHFAFYGGTLYALEGAAAVLFGNVITAFVASQVLAFAAVYGGWYWLARMAGLGRWLAQVPGFLFITSAFYLTTLYGRSDTNELIAVSTIPLMLAAALHTLFARRLSFLPALALAGSTLLFFGSHNLTTTFGLTLIAIMAGAIALLVPEARRWVTRASALRVAGVAVPAALVDCWFLLPDLAYGKRTQIIHSSGFRTTLRGTARWVSAPHLFTFSRATAIPFLKHFVVALPVLAIAWVLVSLAMSCGRGQRGPWRRGLWIFSGAALLLGLLMNHPSPLLIVTTPLSLLQFSFRLESYLLMALSAAVLASLVILARGPRLRRRGWLWGLVPVLAASALGAIEQVDDYPHYKPLTAVFHESIPQGGRGEEGVFDDQTLPRINAIDFPVIDFSANEALRHETAMVYVKLPAGRLARTNLVGAPYFVSVSGAEVVGRDYNGDMVLRVDRALGPAGTKISLHPTNGLPVVLGRVMTLLAVAFLVLLLAWTLAREVRDRVRLQRDRARLRASELGGAR
jgi:hypothetical protein